MKKAAVFLDRDGNINRDVGYPNSFDLVEIYPYSFEALRKINQAGLLAVVISNQSGVGRGLIEEPQLRDIHDRMQEAFRQQKAHFDGIYYCPHFVSSRIPVYDKDCECRKPRPGMGLRAAAELGIDTSRSYMVGDKVADVQFGRNLGARSVLVLTGYGQATLAKLRAQGTEPAHVAQNLLDAVNWILEEENRE
ncbi:MAG: D-glycero-alpha-D-manno-heptose-1,7-bisphosphate 7-phosphatase [Candidatus Aminicenantaceae bacterium]|jgi:D-glycero-D-manno-heptose 1,7-bisphosphate phosphatase